MGSLPNLLMIVVDQQRYDCIGFTNRYPVSTPNIDRLATQGVWFDNAFSHIPLCSPARQSFLNGRRPEAFGALWNYNNGLKVSALQPEEYTWPRHLRELGYQSAYIGKWNVNPNHGPVEYGYDEYISEKGYAEYQQRHYPDVRFTKGYIGEPSPIPAMHAQTHWIAARACEVMQRFHAESRPWHIRVDFPQPHLPCQPSPEFEKMYDPGSVPTWHNFSEAFQQKPYIQRQQLYNWSIENWTWKDWAPVVARYYSMISQVDAAIGEILRMIDALSENDNTIVVFTADHGDMCGAHRMMDKHYVLYDDVVRVPLVVRWPERLTPGLRIAEFVYNFLDFPPTLLDLLDVRVNSVFHGASFAPLLLERPVQQWRTEVVATYNGQQFGLYTERMLRTERFKYVWNTTDVDEFYDLQEDPGELINQIYDPDRQDVIRWCREKLYDELLRCGDGLVESTWMRHQLLDGSKI